MDSIAYICKYTPLELLRSFGMHPHMLDDEQDDFEYAETRTHANMCCHAKAVLQTAADESSVIFTNCCDSLRRVHDVLASDGGKEFLHMVDLPHEESECARDRLARELVRLARELEERTGKSFDAQAFIGSFEPDAARFPSEPFVAVLGARVTRPVLDAIEGSVLFPVVDLTCASHRDIDAASVLEAGASSSIEDLMGLYAGALLRMTPCMRMNDVSRRRELIEDPHLAGIIYNTMKFCDYYGFDYAELMKEAHVPVLKIETDHQPTAPGQLSTRIEAFVETLEMPKTASKKACEGTAVAGRKDARMGMQRLDAMLSKAASASSAGGGGARRFAGIDSGSTTTNMVVLNEAGDVCASAIVRTGAKASRGAQAALDEVCSKLGIGPDDIDAIVATGYGRSNIPFATDAVTEITCHARGVHHLKPHARSIIDIGGQDSKVICLGDGGEVVNFIMNDKCAAGTGRFFEAMARTLEMELADMVKAGLEYKKDVKISSMCTVFAESEVISLIADDVAAQDIIHGLNKAVSSRTAAMAKRAKAKGPFVMTGGVANNPGVVEELSKALESSIEVPATPDLCGALGAALFALESGR